jgi:mRNA interferase RelE/StbE
MFKILYHSKVVRDDIPQLPVVWRKNIERAIVKKLQEHPELYGKPLQRSLKGYYKLRVGAYRVIFRIEKDIVKIFVIQHRSVVYSSVSGRVKI